MKGWCRGGGVWLIAAGGGMCPQNVPPGVWEQGCWGPVFAGSGPYEVTDCCPSGVGQSPGFVPLGWGGTRGGQLAWAGVGD